MQRIEQGQYAEAVNYLNNSLRLAPDSAEALFARGQAYQRLGEFQIAYKDYNSAYHLKADPLVKACEGYCWSRVKLYKRDSHVRLGVEAEYDRPALLYNNIGYSYLMLGQLDDAEKGTSNMPFDWTAVCSPHTTIYLWCLCGGQLKGRRFRKRHSSTQPRPLRSGLPRPICIMLFPHSMQRQQSWTQR